MQESGRKEINLKPYNAALTGIFLLVGLFQFFVWFEIRGGFNHPAFWTGLTFVSAGIMHLLRTLYPGKRLLVAKIAIGTFALFSAFMVIQCAQTSMDRVRKFKQCDAIFDDQGNRATADRLRDLRLVLMQYSKEHDGTYPSSIDERVVAYLNGKVGSGPRTNPFTSKIDLPVLGKIESVDQAQNELTTTGTPGGLEYSVLNHGKDFVIRAFGKTGHILFEPSGDSSIYSVVYATSTFPRTQSFSVTNRPVLLKLDSQKKRLPIPDAVSNVVLGGSGGDPLFDRADSLYQNGENEASRQLLLEALKSFKQKGAPDQKLLAALHRIAITYQAERDHTSEAKFLKTQLDEATSRSATSSFTGTLTMWLIEADNSAGDYGAAAELGEKFLTTTEFDLLPESSRQSVLQSIARAYSRISKHEDSARIWQELVDGSKNDPSNYSTFLEQLALELYRDGKFSDAETKCRKALELKEHSFGSKHMTLVFTLSSLARIYLAAGKLDDAEQCYRRALAIEEEVQGKDAPIVAGTLTDLSAMLRKRDAASIEAKQLSQRALQIDKSNGGRKGSNKKRE